MKGWRRCIRTDLEWFPGHTVRQRTKDHSMPLFIWERKKFKKPKMNASAYFWNKKIQEG
jgi:hypothetical protein